jgi:hypothetical protein
MKNQRLVKEKMREVKAELLSRRSVHAPNEAREQASKPKRLGTSEEL